ncbi:unnamed protein product [Closterium sp. Naga37s-1]|nr:unnamed protein product [Closterium sp. Naga37s-1]
MTATSRTSPRALRAARRGDASQLHEQQHKELVGREGIAAPVEVAEEQETSGGEAAAAAAAVENGATVTESEAAAVAEVADAAGPEAVAAVATVTGPAAVVAPVYVGGLGGLDAAFGGGSSAPSAIPQALQPHAEEPGPAVGLEQTEEAVLAASPEPVTAAALAAAVTAAAGEQDGDLAEEDVPTAAASAETSAAAEGANTQGHGQGGSDRQGHGPGVAACAARGKAGKKLRAQPAPRRPGARLGPGPPGPLLGWLLQGQLPRATPMLAPWIPAGRPQQAGRGEQNAGTRGGATARGEREGGRGARGGRGGRGPIVGGRVALVRTGTWRERHERPKQAEPPTNHNEEDVVNSDEGDDFVAESAEPSEEISLEDEEDVRTARGAGGQRRNQSNGVNPQIDNPQGTGVRDEEVNGEQSEPRVRSPSDLAEDQAIWQQVATCNLTPLQRGDQPFLVRRMPPQILQSYTICILTPLLRLSKIPDCPGAWAVLQYLPRLTLRPAPEPVEGS